MEEARMTKEAFLAELEGVLGLPVGSVGLDAVLRDLPNWDSMKVLDLVFLLEQRGGVSVKMGEAAAWRTVGDIARLAGVADV